jgi:hypothetical protein
MALTNKQTTTHNGFAIPLQSDTDLGLAMLIAEGEDGGHEPVAVVATIREARGVASSDLRDRMRRMDQGDDCLCPEAYKLWARGVGGSYRLVCEITDIL